MYFNPKGSDNAFHFKQGKGVYDGSIQTHKQTGNRGMRLPEF